MYQTQRALRVPSFTMESRKPPRIKSCPICRLAMVGERTDSKLAEFNSYRCLGCDLTITSTPATRGNEK